MEAWTGVVGVAVGAVIGWFAKVWQAKQEWKREDSARWREDRRRAYSEMLDAVDGMRTFAGTIEFMRRGIQVPDGYRAPNDDELNVMFSAALKQVEKARQEIALLASDEVIEQSEAIYRLCALCEVGRAQHPDLLEELEEAKDSFRQVVRNELGVPTSG